MPSNASRKEAIRTFKELKPSVGIYALRCTSTGHAWVGMSRNLDASKNSSWFQLRNRLHQDKSLQLEWDAYGEAAFKYEMLDRIEEDVHPLELHDRLKLKRSDWVARLGAQQLL